MSTKSLVALGVVVVASVGLLAFASRWAGSPVTPGPALTARTSSSSDLAANQYSYNFGTISMKDGVVHRDFTITNTSSSTVTLAGVDTSCMCTTAYVVHADGSKEGPFGMDGMGYRYDASDTLAPGATTTVRVVYDPAAHGPAGVGHIDRTIDLHEANGSTLQLEIAADVTP